MTYMSTLIQYKISIIIPVYGVEKYLNRCVQSVVNQTLREIEIILVDDGSLDNCPQMCDDWAKKDSRIKVIHKKNEGLGFARNTGIDAAHGEYITFLDSDDYVRLDSYKTVVEEAKANDLDICYFQHCRFYDDGTIIALKDITKKELYIGKEAINRYTLDLVGPQPSEKIDIKHSMSSCMGIFRLSIIKEANVRFPSERDVASEDLIFHLDLLPHINRIGVMPNVFYFYYVNPHSITTSYSVAKRNRMLKLLDEVENRLKGRYPIEMYTPHFYSQVLRIIRIILRFESKQKRLFEFKESFRPLLSIPYIKKMTRDSICNDFSFKNRFIIFCMKHNILLLLKIVYIIK